MTTTPCNCLKADDASLMHAARCDAVQDDWSESVDHTDIRELAEIAALRDIDTALSIYRGWVARGSK